MGTPVADAGPGGVLPSVALVDVIDGAAAVVLVVEEGVGACAGVGVGGVEGGVVGAWLGVAVVGCGVGSEVACCPEQSVSARIGREERMMALRRVTGCFGIFIR
jgi:hypothetical protein